MESKRQREIAMNIPIIVGWPQLILIVIGLLGLTLFIMMLTSIARWNYWHEHEEGAHGGAREMYEHERYRKNGYVYGHRHHRPIRWRRGFTGTVLMLIAISLLWLTFLMQTYLGLTADIKVARVHATSTQIPHLMSVEVVLFDKDARQTSDNTYIVKGDEWMLQGDIIKFPTWLNIVGLHSGYKLTRLEGRYDNSDLERHAEHTVIDLNGGDDTFFKTVQAQAWTSPVVEAAYGNAVFLAADGKTYDVFVSQTGLFAKPSR
jgi:hypothetical protein